MPRIVQVVEAFEGGVQRHVIDLLLGLRDLNMAAIVSTGRSQRVMKQISRLREEGLDVQIVPMRRDINLLDDFLGFRHLLDAVRELEPNVVHCHSAKAGFLGRAASQLLGVPAVYTPHALSFHPFESSGPRTLYLALERLAGFWTTRLIAVSPSEARQVRSARLVPDRKIVTIPNGVPIPEALPDKSVARQSLRLPSDRTIVICIAHLRRQKAPFDWLKMAQLALQKRSDLFFAWLGDGPLEKRFLARAREMLGPENFRYLGYRASVQEAIAGSDIFTLSSLWEGLPYALLEAMAGGVPPVVTRVNGAVDVVRHRENGLISDLGDPAALAQSVVQLAENANLRRSMGIRARAEIANHYSLEQMLNCHRELYGEVARSGKNARSAGGAVVGNPGESASEIAGETAHGTTREIPPSRY